MKDLIKRREGENLGGGIIGCTGITYIANTELETVGAYVKETKKLYIRNRMDMYFADCIDKNEITVMENVETVAQAKKILGV